MGTKYHEGFWYQRFSSGTFVAYVVNGLVN